MQGKKVVAGLGITIVLAMGLGGVVAWQIRKVVERVPPPAASPDGRYVAQLSVTDSRGDPATHMRLVVTVRDAQSQAVVLRRQTRASGLRYYDLRWEGAGELLLDSSEVGKLKWYVGADGAWEDDKENGNRIVTPENAGSFKAPALGR